MKETGELERRLGLRDLVFVVMGAIIGVGVFFTPAAVAKNAGSVEVALGAWIAGGLMALAGALTFAELGALMPRTGGQFHILKAAFGRPIAFLYGWSLLTTIQSGAVAIVSLICVQFGAKFLGVENLSDRASRGIAVFLIAALVTANISGVRTGAWIGNLTMLTKIVILLIIAWIALRFVGEPIGKAATAAAPVWSNLLPALVPVLFSIGGWQQGTYIAGEVKSPEKTLPIGIIVGVMSVILLYLLVNYGALSVLSVDKLAASKTAIADVVTAAAGQGWGAFTSLAVAISALGVSHVCILTAPRMYKAMADDDCFFKSIAAVHPRFGTPAVALAVQGTVSSLLVLVAGVDGVDRLLTGVVSIDCVFFALTGAALIILRKKLPDAPRPFRVPLYPIVPIVFVLAEIAALVGAFMNPQTVGASVTAVIVLLTGGVAYVFFRLRVNR